MPNELFCLCPICEEKQNAVTNKPNKCCSCKKYFAPVGIQSDHYAYNGPAMKNKECFNKFKKTYPDSSHSTNFEAMGIFRMQDEEHSYPVVYKCLDDGDGDSQGLGATHILLQNELNIAAPTIIYPIYECFYSDCSQKYFHGTPGGAEGIQRDGLIVEDIKKNIHKKMRGFDESLRFAGITKGPALAHAGNDADAQVVRLRYSGWILRTRILIRAYPYQSLFAAAPTFGGIEFFECGRAIAFSKNARLYPAGWSFVRDIKKG